MYKDISKEQLREQLFSKYFEVEDGVLAIDFVSRLSFIPKIWKELHFMCEKNIEYCEFYTSLHQFKLVQYNNKIYVILYLGTCSFVVINTETCENITEYEFKSVFDFSFFQEHFGVCKEDEDFFSYYCHLEEYHGDIQELMNFYTINQKVLQFTPNICYEIYLEEASTYLFISFIQATAQIGFQTPDQFLYDQLFLNYDLTPCSMQDAQDRIGFSRMQDIFTQIQEIYLPKEIIPSDLYQEYLNRCDLIDHQFKK